MVNFIINDINLKDNKLIRSDKIQKEYFKYLALISKQDITPEERINDAYFKDNKQMYAITENDYPYDLPKKYKHMLLWVKSPSISPLKVLSEEFGLDKVKAVWETPPKNKA